MLDTSQILADRLAIIGELPVTVTISGVAYTGRKSQRKTSVKYSEFGALDSYQFSVSISTATSITVDDIATISTVEYRILSIDIGAIDAMKIIHLGSKYE